MTITNGDVRSLPTVLSLWGAGPRLEDGPVDEVDIVFFAPPTTEALACRSRDNRDEASGRLDRTLGYVDEIGRLVAEVYVSGSARPVGEHGASVPLADELLHSVVERFDLADVRRLRMRFYGHSAGPGSQTWSVTVLQRYRTDHEDVEDVALIGTDPSGSVVARAWVTVAADR
ncbi:MULTISPECIES: hypothetical protein [Rhodococcus]|uniref:Uncharacterized protein n=1 Tax=Rhodococcus pyridinivorans AK37 TaxID=1114960 RepID=H0JTQ1_9NOCA|nr:MULTISPECIES: hypothetical protein [Rhodococcus]AWZ26417.1 hypothetical protein CEJ39_21525 [Rhodococcus pyridinivorans]EHK82592.1 hypothetical protein AK37_15343 [Rhodococcus pyridinivorans AK37]KHJ72449.1 hypothetical protein QR64_13810 [Rhodococcus sp. Chr-9]MCD2141582.1 hypothetical protein [Rhodococcus pyridinivorans]MCW3472315.1 hypothetical protein [Rhodococcus pyridinivorans]